MESSFLKLQDQLLIYKDRLIQLIVKNFNLYSGIFENLASNLKNIRNKHSFFDPNLVEAHRMKNYAEKSKKEYSERNKLCQEEISKEILNQKEKIKEILSQISQNVENSDKMVEELFSKIQRSIEMVIDETKFQEFLMAIIKIILIILAGAGTAAVAQGSSVWFPIFGWVAAGGAVALSEKNFKDNLDKCIDKADSLCEQTLKHKKEAVSGISQYYDNFINACQNVKQNISEKMFMDYQNLIWFDKNIQNSENKYCQDQLKHELTKKLNFYFINDIETLKKQLDKLDSKTFFISSGSAYKEISNLLPAYDVYVKHIIIFTSKIIEKYKKSNSFLSMQDIIVYINKELESEQSINNLNDGVILVDKFKDYYSAVLFLLTDEFSYKSFSEIPLEISSYDSIKTFANSNGINFDWEYINMFVELIKTFRDNDNKVAEELLKLYTAAGPFYKTINKALYKIDFKFIQLCEIWIKSLLLAFKKKKQFYKNYQKKIFYRGVTKDPKIKKQYVEQFKKNDAFFLPAFLSTSESEDEAKNFSNGIILEIHYESKSSKNMPFLDINKIGSGSCFPSEKEFLFEPFSMFVVKEIREDKDHNFLNIVFDNI